MKLIVTRAYLFNLLTSCFLLSTACSSSNEQPAKVVDKEPVPTASATAFFYINDAENQGLADINVQQEKISIRLVSKELFGVKKKPEKRKYYDASDKMHYAVKYGEDGFKLRNAQEEMLWKVKFTDTGIKLSQDEAMEDAFKITHKDGKTKVKQGDEEISSLRVREGDQLIEIPKKYLLNGFNQSLAIGILLIPTIPEEEKFMLCAEIVSQGK